MLSDFPSKVPGKVSGKVSGKGPRRAPRRRSGRTAVLSALTVVTVLGALAPAGAQSAPVGTPASAAVGTAIPASGTVSAAKPVSRRAPDEGSAAAAAPAAKVPFRPTMDEAAYRAAKDAAERAPVLPKPGANAPGPLAPPFQLRQFEGLNQNESGGLRPPDNDGAHGFNSTGNYYVATVNSAIRIWNTAPTPPTIVSTKSLATFFGYTTTTLFDPRVVYDAIWDRWIVLAEAFPESATVQRVFIGISQTGNPNGAYWIYNIDRGGSGTGEVFWDYGQLGYDQDALLFTANIFPNSGGFAGAEFFCFSKAGMYNGLGVSSPVFSGLDSTLAPPKVLDNNANTFLLAAPNATAALSLYRANNCGRTGTSLVKQANIAVPAYAVPPTAPQPGSTNKLDTLDNRFQNRSTQYGTSLWNVHTIALGGFAAPKWYQLNTSTNSVVQSDVFFKSGTSHDFNPSIAARPNGTMFVSWTATDPGTNTQAQIRYSGRRAGDPANTTNEPGAALFTSAVAYNPSSDTVERWGDYSSVVFAESSTAQDRAYVVSEKINSATVWGSRVGHVGF